MLLGANPDDFTKEYQLSDTSDDQKRIGIRRSLTDDLKVGVGLEEMRRPQYTNSGTPEAYAQTLEGEMAVSDRVSLNVSRKVLTYQENNGTRASEQKDQQPGETQIYLKYKRNF
jgi:hypothetical protein